MTATASAELAAQDGTSRTTSNLAAWSAAAAAAAHVAVVPEHLVEWPAAGVFFVVLAIGQAVLAGALYVAHPGPRALAAAAWANIGVVVLYVISRTAGSPSAPADHAHGGEALTEAVGGAELVALVSELTLIALLIAMLPPKMSRRTSTLVMLAGATLWTSSALGLLG